MNKTFVSKIENISRDESNEIVLEIQMIDVSTDDDININDKLVAENRAIKC